MYRLVRYMNRYNTIIELLRKERELDRRQDRMYVQTAVELWVM